MPWTKTYEVTASRGREIEYPLADNGWGVIIVYMSGVSPVTRRQKRGFASLLQLEPLYPGDVAVEFSHTQLYQPATWINRTFITLNEFYRLQYAILRVLEFTDDRYDVWEFLL